MKTNGKPRRRIRREDTSLTKISVKGFKSIIRPQSIEFGHLTILAGANSSGKSSMMQPLLLLKQTVDAPYDPGELLFYGPNVKFTSVAQMISKTAKYASSREFFFEVECEFGRKIDFQFGLDGKDRPVLKRQRYSDQVYATDLSPELTHAQLNKHPERAKILKEYQEATSLPGALEWAVLPNRCFLEAAIVNRDEPNEYIGSPYTPSENFAQLFRSIIHLPGLRGNAERVYPVARVGPFFEGTFDHYVASVISEWSSDSHSSNLDQLGTDLKSLGLTRKLTAQRLNNAQVELRVDRMPVSSSEPTDRLVNIADVGVGVSQALPVVTALLAADAGEMVYIEQPEIHLHPRALVAMAQLLANAANRGVRVVIETHSSLLLLGIQTLVAEGKLAPEKVKLHWFTRDPKDGATTVRSADMDEAGAFGEDWPEDFGSTELEAQRRYLDAADARLAGKPHG